MPIKDDSLAAQYIRAIENPDSAGFNNGRWEAPPKGKGYDINSRGFGMDINYNDATKALTANRKGKWLTEEEERQLRLSHMNDNQETLNKRTASPYIRRTPLTEEKEAMAIGMLYRGDGIKSIVRNPAIRDSYYSGSNEDMQKAVAKFYEKKGYAPRAKNHNQFLNSRKSATNVASRFEAPKFVPKHKLFSEGGYLDDSSWDNLSMKDKAEMMRVAIANGITTLPEIRQAYNEFAKGGQKDSYIDADDRRHKILLEEKEGNLYDSNGNNYTQSYLDEDNVPVITGTMPRNTSQYYDPSMTFDFINAATAPISNFTPSNIIGSLRKVEDYPSFMNSFMNQDNNGFFTDSYANEHPMVSTLGNLAGDILVTEGFDMFKDLTKNTSTYRKLLYKTNKLKKKLGLVDRGLPIDGYKDNITYTTNTFDNTLIHHPELGNDYKRVSGFTDDDLAEFVNEYKDRAIKAPTTISYNGKEVKLSEPMQKLFADNPEYYEFIQRTGLNPNAQETVDKFIKRQGTSIRGVTAPSKEEAERYLTETENGRYMKGGDRLKTNGGLYTSNSTGIADAFKNPVGNSTEDGYVATLHHDFNIDRSKPIEEQLRQYRNQVGFASNGDIFHGTTLEDISRQKYIDDGVAALEASYGRSNGDILNVTERGYLPEGLRGTKGKPVKIMDLQVYPNLKDQRGRWNTAGVDYTLEDENYFLPRQYNSTSDFIRNARLALKKDWVPNTEKRSQLYNDIFNTHIDRIKKSNQMKRSVLDFQDKVKTNAAIGLGAAGLTIPPGAVGMYVYNTHLLGTYKNYLEDYYNGDNTNKLTPENIQEIYDAYRDLGGHFTIPTNDSKEKAYGGTLFGKGGYIPSDSIKKRITNWEGSSMKTNRSFAAEASDFNRVIPAEIRSKLSHNQLDALYSYGYNVGMGKLKERVLPTLTAYTQGKASKEDVQRSMWASRDNELRGLTTRRNAERELFGGNFRTKFTGTGGLGTHIDLGQYLPSQESYNGIDTMINTMPMMQFPSTMDVDPTTLYKAPTIDDTLFANPKAEEEVPVYNPQQERRDNLMRFNTIMGLIGGESPLAGLGDTSTPGLLSYINQIYS